MKNKRRFWIGFSISLLLHGVMIGSFFSFQNKPQSTYVHKKHSTSMVLSLSVFQKPDVAPIEAETKEPEPIQKTEVVKKPSQHPKKEKQMVVKESEMAITSKVADSATKNHENTLQQEELNNDAPAKTVAQQNSSSGTEAKDTFLSDIQAIIEKHKTYPKWARKMHIEGTVMVEFEISQEGKLLWSKVITTSGNTALDEHALSVLQKASEEFPNPRVVKIIKVPMAYKFI
jgi:protein TonB